MEVSAPCWICSHGCSATDLDRKHVLSDLRPYICLAEDCPVASREYVSRHEWMNHVLHKHWKRWVCPYQCGLNNTAETNMRQHITSIHGPATEMELDAMIARCGQIRSLSPSSPIECPFCKDMLESVQQYQRHVGRHQVDLALFALPKIQDDEEESDGRNNDQETTSTHSSSYPKALVDDIFPNTASAEPPEAIDENDEEKHESRIRMPDLEWNSDHEIFNMSPDESEYVRRRRNLGIPRSPSI